MIWSDVSHEPEPPSLGIKSGTVKIIGPADGWRLHEEHEGEIMALKYMASYVEPDVQVSIHTENFDRFFDCLRITGDTWTVPGVEQWKMSNVWFTGIFSFLTAKLLGYDRILIFGVPADYSVPAKGRGKSTRDAQYNGWSMYRRYFTNTTAFGGNLPKWFPELKCQTQ